MKRNVIKNLKNIYADDNAVSIDRTDGPPLWPSA
jgi:hypothetical protein